MAPSGCGGLLISTGWMPYVFWTSEHAAEYLSNAAHAVWGEGALPVTAWLDQQLHELNHGDPASVLAALVDLPATTDQARTTRGQVIAYLTKRRAQLAYADFRNKGYPVGDGIVERANKLVVEQRLKGAGMHWQRANVNPMVALRACTCSDQWATGWGQLTTELRRAEQERRRQRHADRRAAKTPSVEETRTPEASEPEEPPTQSVRPQREKTMVDGRPTANHPWRRFCLSSSRPSCKTLGDTPDVPYVHSIYSPSRRTTEGVECGTGDE
ncbi:MAG: hypothetical protein ACR2GA_00380 [Chloroflexota bacterium]